MDFQKVLGQIERPFTFAVVGDTHFTQPEFFPDPDLSAVAFRPLAADQYIQNVDYALAPMMDALKVEDPAFIVMTGDLVEGFGEGEVGRAEMQVGLDFFASYGIPLLLARGNHDRPEAFAEVVRQQGTSVTLRHSLGRSQDAACGQLRRRQIPTQL